MTSFGARDPAVGEAVLAVMRAVVAETEAIEARADLTAEQKLAQAKALNHPLAVAERVRAAVAAARGYNAG